MQRTRRWRRVLVGFGPARIAAWKVLAGLLVLAVVITVSITWATHRRGSNGPFRVVPQAHPVLGSVPNFVFVLTDDLSTNLVRYMPAVESMERAGTSLSNYYVSNSLCCPSRATILTGDFPHNTGVLNNAGAHGGYHAFQRHQDERRTYAVALREAGYRTGFFGKYLNRYLATDPVPPGWTDWAGIGAAYQEFNYDLNVNGTPRHFGHAPGDYLTDVMSRLGTRFIERSVHARTPFAVQLSTFAPHAPYIPAPRYADADRSVTYPRTRAFNRLPVNGPAWLNRGRAPLSSAQIAEMQSNFRQRVRADLATNDLIVSLRNTLQRLGVANNTYVIFSSDNGYHMGEYRLTDGKRTAFDTDIRVPLVVTGPGVPQGRSVAAMASSVDLAPTLVDLAGAAALPDADGVSLAPLFHGRVPDDWQQGVLVEHHGVPLSRQDPDRQFYTAGIPPSYYAVRTSDALYVQYNDGTKEYYDTRHDPQELDNLAGDGVPTALQQMVDGLRDCHGVAECQWAVTVAGR